MLRNEIFKRALYIILDLDLPYFKKDHISVAKDLISAGVDILQLRSKLCSGRYLFEIGAKIKKFAKKDNVIFIINDRLDIVQAIDADGIHLGQDDLPVNFARNILGRDKIIGLSTHNLSEAKKSQLEDIDYISVGPIFKSPTKPNLQPLGIEILNKIVKISKFPIVAIGGITLKNIQEILACGVNCVAVISSIFKSEDVVETVRTFKRLLTNFSYGY